MKSGNREASKTNEESDEEKPPEHRQADGTSGEKILLFLCYSTSWRDEEELVDYEPEDPPCFSPPEDDISEPDDRARTPVPRQAGSSLPDYELGSKAADYVPIAGQKRRPNSPEEDELRRKAPKDDSAASLRRGGKSVPILKDDNVANLPRTASGGSKTSHDEEKSAAPPRKGGRSAIPAKQDELANLPTSALEGSKSSDELDGGGL